MSALWEAGAGYPGSWPFGAPTSRRPLCKVLELQGTPCENQRPHASFGPDGEAVLAGAHSPNWAQLGTRVPWPAPSPFSSVVLRITGLCSSSRWRAWPQRLSFGVMRGDAGTANGGPGSLWSSLFSQALRAPSIQQAPVWALGTHSGQNQDPS